MKILSVLFFTVSLKVMACVGGVINLPGNLILTAENASYNRGGLEEGGRSAENMFDDKQSVGWGGNDATNVIVPYLKRDAGGIIYTIYKVTSDAGTRFYKLNSGYMGNGVRARGVSEVEPKFNISQEAGCK